MKRGQNSSGFRGPLGAILTSAAIISAQMIIAVTLILAISGCGTTGDSTPSTAGSGPNPLRGQTRFAVEPIDMSSMTVDDVMEKEFLASRKPQQVTSWEGDKAGIQENFTK